MRALFLQRTDRRTHGRTDGRTDGRTVRHGVSPPSDFSRPRCGRGGVASWGRLWRWCLVAVDGGRGGRARRLHARPGVGLDAGRRAGAGGLMYVDETRNLWALATSKEVTRPTERERQTGRRQPGGQAGRRPCVTYIARIIPHRASAPSLVASRGAVEMIARRVKQEAACGRGRQRQSCCLELKGRPPVDAVYLASQYEVLRS